MQAEYKLTLPPLDDADAEPLAAQRMEEAQRTLGFVPNMYRRLRHERAAPQPLVLRHPLREWLDGVSDALCMLPPLAAGLTAPSPLRQHARAYAYRGLRASCFALPWRAALVP